MGKMNANPEFWMKKIERMLESGDYEYARKTLSGIWDYIDTSERGTENQMEAIQNIKRGGDRL